MSIINIRDEVINRAIESGRFYVDQPGIKEVGGIFFVDVYYHRNYAHPYSFDNEWAVEFFLDQLEKYGGYSDYETFSKENDYDMATRYKEVYEEVEL